MTDDRTDRKRDSAPASLRHAEAQAKASQKLLEILVIQIIKVYRDKDLPKELKLLLTPLLFMVPLYSLVLVIFIGELAYSAVRQHDLMILYYLIFLGVTATVILSMLLIYSLVASRFENSRHLDLQMQSVTNGRAPRKRRPPNLTL